MCKPPKKGSTIFSPQININTVSGVAGKIISSGQITRVNIVELPFRFTLTDLGESVDMEFFRPDAYNVIIDFNK